MTQESSNKKSRPGIANPLLLLRSQMAALTFGNPLYSLSLAGQATQGVHCIPPDPWPCDASQGRQILKGVYSFGGQTLEFPDKPSWEPFGASDAWLSGLHGFDWLRDLRAIGGDAARQKARDLVSDWMNNYRRWDSIAWRADITGRRLASWIVCHDFFCASADPMFQERVCESLSRQARHLSRALPGKFFGLELVLAIRGLIYSGLCLTEGHERVEQGLKLLASALNQQILADGGHVARSPAVHLQCLQALLDLRAAFVAADLGVPAEVQHVVDRMIPVLRLFRHGDGGLALFNGTQDTDLGAYETYLSQAGLRGGKALKTAPYSGFERITQGRTVVIMDTGGMPPQKYSRQAHAGTLSFEMSVGRERLVVNCGAHPGSPKWTEALRSTAAHSTVTIDHANSAVFRDDGTIGRQPEVISERHAMEGTACLVEASHNGYVPSHSLTHKRRLFLADAGQDLRGEDRLIGRGATPYAVRFHLHPGVRASLVQQDKEVLMQLPGGTGWRFKFAAPGATLSMQESIYMGRPSMPRRSQQIVVSGLTDQGATAIKWAFKREKK